MLILRTSPASPFGRKVPIAAEVAAVADRIRVENADTGNPDDSLRRQNPLGKIPTLLMEDGDAFCFYGYGGQLLVMSPRKRLVMHDHSVSHSTDGVWLPTYGVIWGMLGPEAQTRP